MWPALPAPEYYGDSAPSRTDRSTVDPALGHAGDVTAGETRDGSRVHCDSLDRGGARLCPSGLATATPQPFTVASPSAGFTDSRSSPPHIHTGVDDAPLPAHIRQVRAGKALWDFTTSVPRVLLSITLTGPASSDSADTSRPCRGCSHPPRHLPDQAAPSFCQAAATARRHRSLTSAQITALHGARSQRSMRSRSPSTAGSPRPATNQCQGRIHH
jgi:hypothetical protein